MTKNEQAKLRTAIREIVKEFRNSNRPHTSRQIVEEVRERFPELVAQASEAAVNETMAKWARAVMKERISEINSPQFVLPFEIAHLKLPNEISLEQEDGEMLWLPLENVTFRELGEHIGYIRGIIASNQACLREELSLYDFLAPHMADEAADDPIGPMLKRLAVESDAA